MEDSRYKSYRDCSIDELEEIVNDLENMSISALKNKKLDIRRTILGSVIEAKKEIERRLKKQYNQLMLIGLVGLISSGKDTVANRLVT